MAMAYITAFIVSGAIVLFAGSIYRLFTTDQTVVKIGVHMIRFLIPSYALYVVIGILSGALRGAGRVLVPMILTCGGVCLLRIIWLFAQLSGVLGNYCGAVCHLLFPAFSRYTKKEITI